MKALVLAALTIAALVTPAQSASAAQTCLGGAVTAHYGDAAELGPYTTTTRCVDVNLRVTGGTASYVNACTKFARTGQCNHWTRVDRGDGWRTIATDVLDGTRFTVPLGVPLEGDSATVQIAF